METKKSVGIWIRVSTEDQKKGESPEHHEQRAKMYAEFKGWEVKEVYHLEGISGKTVVNEAETTRMIQDIKSKKISGLIFSKLARLGRNTRELLDFSDLFQKHEADLISLQESIDTSTPAGRLFYTVVAALAQWEREEISERVAASVPVRAKLGKPLGGAAPFGYRWVEKTLQLDKQEAPVRKLMYELFLKHKRKRTVANLLNEQGYRTRKNAKFSDTTVGRLLRDPIAKGLRRANYSKSLGKGKQWEIKPEEDWVFTQAPVIVSEEIWNQVQLILDEQAAKNKRKARRVRHLFAGKTQCVCGGKMYVPSNNPKYTCKVCKNKIGEQDLEDIFHTQLQGFLYSDTEITSYLDKAHASIKDQEVLRENLKQQAKEIHQKLDNIMELYHAGELPKQGFNTYYNPLHEQYEQTNKQIATLQAEIDFLKVQYASSDQVFHEARTLYDQWYTLSFEEKREITENVVESIIVGESDIEINLSYIPTPSPPNTPSISSFPFETMATTQHNHRGSSKQST